MATRTASTGTTFAPVRTRHNPANVGLPVPNELAPSAPTTDPFAMFDDPSTALFTKTLGQQINALQTPIADPTRDAVMALISRQIPNLLNSSVPSVGYGGNPLMNDLITQGRQRITELNQEPYSQGEEAAMKTRAAEDVEQLRTSSRQRALEDTARLGQAKTSGTLQARYEDVDRTADSARAKGTNDLMLAIAAERQRRKDQAVSVAQGLASAGQAEAGMEMQGQGLQLQAQGLKDNRTNTAMSLAQVLSSLSSGARSEQEARRKEAVGYTGMLADLPMQRLQAISNIFNGSTSNPASILTGLQSLSNAQTGVNNTNNQNQQAMLEGLAKILGYYAK